MRVKEYAYDLGVPTSCLNCGEYFGEGQLVVEDDGELFCQPCWREIQREVREENEMNDNNDNLMSYLSVTGLSLNIHDVVNVKIQRQRFTSDHVQLKFVIERSSQDPMEITCFAPAGNPPTWEYIGEWVYPQFEPKNEGE